MPKRTKTITALIGFTDKEQSNAFKRMMIQAHLESELKPAREKVINLFPVNYLKIELNQKLILQCF